MKAVLNIVGALVIVIGVIWVLQGINVLPGSFMTGQMQWAYNGAIAIVVGVVVLILARKLGRKG